VDPNWNAITVMQGDKKLVSRRATDAQGAYVLYDAVPNGAEIVVSGR
jgi:hypothetical protein